MSDREWIARLAEEATSAEVAQCMEDLLDRAEFAEEIARRRILERLVAALNQQPFSSLSKDTLAVLREFDDLRETA